MNIKLICLVRTLGVDSTIGAGVYIIIDTVAREHYGLALAISFIIAGITIGLLAFCYSELASRCPSAESAYSTFVLEKVDKLKILTILKSPLIQIMILHAKHDCQGFEKDATCSEIGICGNSCSVAWLIG